VKLLFPLLFIALSLALSFRAARRTRNVHEFFTAGGRVGTWQNGLALTGDYLSAAAFLGAAGMVATQGYDSIVYAIGTLLGWPLLMLLFSEKLRALGRYTVADVVASRFGGKGVRLMTATNALVVTVLYLVVQMVGAGKIMELLFGLPYGLCILLVGGLMLVYVMLGGMTATTWVQVLKAVLMFVCSIVLSVLVLLRFGGVGALFQAAAGASARGFEVFMPSPALSNPWEVLSLGLGLTLGLLGLPHVLMRFFTVPDTRTAKRSAGLASALIALFFSLNILIGYGALALVSNNPAYVDASGGMRGGNNMAAVHLAHNLGGSSLEGFVAAIALATILAVVAGLAMSGAGTLAHDVYAQVLHRKTALPWASSEARKLWISRLAALVLGLLGMALSTLVQELNIAFLMGLAFAVAASSHFPVLFLSLFWKGFTAEGAVAAGITGSLAALSCIVMGPTLWVDILGNEAALFPLANPALVSVPLALLAGWVGSFLSPRVSPRVSL